MFPFVFAVTVCASAPAQVHAASISTSNARHILFFIPFSPIPLLPHVVACLIDSHYKLFPLIVQHKLYSFCIFTYLNMNACSPYIPPPVAQMQKHPSYQTGMLPVAAPTNCCKSCSSETEAETPRKDLHIKNDCMQTCRIQSLKKGDQVMSCSSASRYTLFLPIRLYTSSR